MSNLQSILNEIKEQKDTLLVPENLRSGVTLLGVEGTLEELITPEDYSYGLELEEEILGIIGTYTANSVGPVLNDILGTETPNDVGGTFEDVEDVFDDILGN